VARKVIIVTGEVSGDIYGGLLAAEIHAHDPAIQISGVGGERMRGAGVETFLDSEDLSVVGFWEAITRLGRLHSALRSVKRHIRERKPDLLILIDYPGMNLRLAMYAKKLGIKVMYYVSPQVWAWGRNRVKIIKRNVDKMVVILPFEVDFYKAQGVDVTYVGHPLIDIVKTGLDKASFFAAMELAVDGRLITLMPGSRPQEIKNHMAPLLETAGHLAKVFPDVRFVVVSLPAFTDALRAEVAAYGADVRVTSKYGYEALKYCDLAIACSGTATLEAALLETPMIVIYKLAVFSWAVGRLIVKVPYISLANLIAGKQVVPEFLQSDVDPGTLAQEAGILLTDCDRRDRMIRELTAVREKLGPGGASTRAALEALSLMA
jgi:lipid-A-disaccharide synthase